MASTESVPKQKAKRHSYIPEKELASYKMVASQRMQLSAQHPQALMNYLQPQSNSVVNLNTINGDINNHFNMAPQVAGPPYGPVTGTQAGPTFGQPVGMQGLQAPPMQQEQYIQGPLMQPQPCQHQPLAGVQYSIKQEPGYDEGLYMQPQYTAQHPEAIPGMQYPFQAPSQQNFGFQTPTQQSTAMHSMQLDFQAPFSLAQSTQAPDNAGQMVALMEENKKLRRENAHYKELVLKLNNVARKVRRGVKGEPFPKYMPNNTDHDVNLEWALGCLAHCEWEVDQRIIFLVTLPKEKRDFKYYVELPALRALSKLTNALRIGLEALIKVAEKGRPFQDDQHLLTAAHEMGQSVKNEVDEAMNVMVAQLATPS